MLELDAAKGRSMKVTIVPSLAYRSQHNFATKVNPLSEVALVGSRKLGIQWRTNAVQHSAEVTWTMGMVSIQRVVLSKTVSRYLIPLDSGMGPTTSISKSENLGERTGLFSTGGAMVLPTFVC